MASMEPSEDDPFQRASHSAREISEKEKELLARQDARPVPEFRSKKFQAESRKHWDLFYKRNEDRFFKDRHWTRREFQELAGIGDSERDFLLMEVGCGAGNFAFPLLQECLKLSVLACDFSERAVNLVKANPNYDGERIRAFKADITADALFPDLLDGKHVDAMSLVFVLSAVAPEKFPAALSNLKQCLKPGGKILFRDYAVNDMAMVRFGPGTKLGERHYLRQDGTSSYFFTREELESLANQVGLGVQKAEYVFRRTVNRKEGVDAERVFLQAVMVNK